MAAVGAQRHKEEESGVKIEGEGERQEKEMEDASSIRLNILFLHLHVPPFAPSYLCPPSSLISFPFLSHITKSPSEALQSFFVS